MFIAVLIVVKTGDSVGKESTCNARNTGVGSIPGLGRSPGEGHSNPPQYSCLKNPMDRGTWLAMVHRVTKSWTCLKWLSTHRAWNKPKCPSTYKWIKKMWYIYTTECYSAPPKGWNNAICINMNWPRDYHTNWSQRQMWLIHGMLKNGTSELIYKIETDSQT